MDGLMVQMMLGLALGVNRAVEVLKPGVARFGWSDDVQRGVLTLLSLLLGIVGCIALQLNAFSDLALYEYQIPVFSGVVITGMFVAGGASSVHWLTTVLALFKNPLEQPTTNVSTVTETRTTEVATTTPPAPQGSIAVTPTVTPADVETVFAQLETTERQRDPASR